MVFWDGCVVVFLCTTNVGFAKNIKHADSKGNNWASWVEKINFSLILQSSENGFYTSSHVPKCFTRCAWTSWTCLLLLFYILSFFHAFGHPYLLCTWHSECKVIFHLDLSLKWQKFRRDMIFEGPGGHHNRSYDKNFFCKTCLLHRSPRLPKHLGL